MMMLWSLLLSRALAGEADVHYQQARLHLRRNWYDAAEQELRAAVATPEGRARYDICLLAAEVALHQLDISWAAEMADAAADAAPDDAARADARALADRYRERFGTLTVSAPHPGMASRLQLESTGLVVNPDWKRFINRAALRWRERTALPATLWLPAGSYLINGHAVTVTGGQDTPLALPMAAIGPRALTALQVTRLEASAGVRALSGPAAANTLPGLSGQLGVLQPVGPLLVGATARASRITTLDSTGQQVPADPALDGVLRLGVEGALAGALSVRTAARVGGGRLTGVPLACDARCTLAGDLAPTAAGTVGGWLAGGDLTIEYREAGRTTAMGTGVSFVAERAWGTLPETLDDGAATDGSRWSAGSVMMLANLSLAL